MRRSLVLALTTATAAVALEDWIRVWPKSGRQSRRLTSDLDCAPFDASHLVARPRRKRADCQFYDQPDKNDDGLLCIGDRFKIANEVSFCAEPYSPGSWYLAAKKGIDLGQGRPAARGLPWVRVVSVWDVMVSVWRPLGGRSKRLVSVYVPP